MNIVEDLEKRNRELELEINTYRVINQTLKETFINSQVALEVFDSLGRLVDCNPACLNAFGIENIDQIKEYNLFQDYRIELQKLEKIKNGQEVRYEFSFDFDKIHNYNLYKTNKAGVYIFDCSIKPISNNNGYLVFLIDITKSKETEQNLSLTNKIYKEKEETLRSIIESTNDFIWTVDPINFRIQSYNSAIYNYFISARNTIIRIGSTPDQLIPDYKKWIKYYQSAIKEGHVEFDYTIMNGNYSMYFSLNAMYKDGELFGISVFGRDITLQTKFKKDIIKKNKLLREKNRELLKSEQLFRNLIESSTMGIMIFDSFGIKFVNKNLSDLAGYPKDKIEGSSPLLFIHPDDRVYFKNKLEIRKQGLDFNEDINIRGITSSGEIRDLLVLCSYAIIDSNQVFIANIVDYTIRKQAESELIRAKEKAEESDKLIISFLHNMSHEIKTPLNSITGFSQIICDAAQGNEELEVYSNIISENSEKLIDIIKDIIDVSNIYSNESNLEIVDFDFSGLIDEIRLLYHKKAEENGLSFVSIIDIPSEEAIIKSDKQKIKMILSHLISNSIKFTKQGKVEVYASIANDSLVISVIDTGIGISEKHQKLIFEPFRQIDSGENRNFGGNGLGLSIVKSFIDLLHGSIDIKSELGKGTTIKITIPHIPSCHN